MARDENDKLNSHAIQTLNDAFRKTFLRGSVLLTAGIIQLGRELETQVLASVTAVRSNNSNLSKH